MKRIPVCNVLSEPESSNQILNNHLITRYFKGLMLVIGCGIAIQAGLIAYEYLRQDVVMTAEEKAKYQTAQKGQALLSKRLTAIRLAQSEDPGIVKAIDTLAFVKPAQVRWTNVEMMADQEIRIEGIAADPALFGTYVEAINREESIFHNARLSRMAPSGSNGLKMFTIEVEPAVMGREKP